MKQYFFFFMLMSSKVFSQELFVFTEPASNMAAKSIGVRLNNSLMKKNSNNTFNYLLVPEVMLGVSKKIMVHGDVFLSNKDEYFSASGGSVYGKYRFLSNDDVQKHFRMTAFGRMSYNDRPTTDEEINLYGTNSGWELGVTATQLLHKLAFSSGLSFVNATANNIYKFPTDENKAINYTLSIGKLMLPKEYKTYSQTNMNLMIELLNQINMVSGKYYLDLAPSLQLIFNSQTRLDIAYRKQITGSLHRNSYEGIFIRLEHNFFNVW